MNDQNLRPIKLSHDEAVRNGRKGGRVSARTRQSVRKLKEIAVAEFEEHPERKEELIRGLIERAEMNSKDLQLLMSIIGEVPEKELNTDRQITFCFDGIDDFLMG